MKKFLLPFITCLLVFSARAQNYELQSKTKLKELFTTTSMDSLEAKVIELQHSTNTVYYDWSEFTTVIIYPKTKAIKKEGEE